MKTNKGSVSQFIGSCAALLPRAWAVLILAVAVAVEAGGITIESVQAKQRYPWNGLVDIDYTVVTNGTETLDVDDCLEVYMVDGDTEPAVTNRANCFLQAPLPLTAGEHRITWDANYDGFTNHIEKARFIVKIAHYSAVYMVIDVSGGSATNCYPVDFLNGAPSGGFSTGEYKSDKIVLRRIRPGSYLAGSAPGEAGGGEVQHRVALSKPFYIGLFEVTQEQYFNVMGARPSAATGEYHPVENVPRTSIRGTGTDPSKSSFMGVLVEKCKSRDENGEYVVDVKGFDLPTEFQWEYACRAGTTKAFNLTDDFDNTSTAAQAEQMALAGRYGNQSAGHAVVGSYRPNAWDLYDMHGNVWEWCLDVYRADVQSMRQYVDPQGPGGSGTWVARGGRWGSSLSDCRSAKRENTGSASANFGFRLSRTLP